jgi:hypothetical protein
VVRSTLTGPRIAQSKGKSPRSEQILVGLISISFLLGWMVGMSVVALCSGFLKSLVFTAALVGALQVALQEGCLAALQDLKLRAETAVFNFSRCVADIDEIPRLNSLHII